jgi:hypothetical protein
MESHKLSNTAANNTTKNSKTASASNTDTTIHTFLLSELGKYATTLHVSHAQKKITTIRRHQNNENKPDASKTDNKLDYPHVL